MTTHAFRSQEELMVETVHVQGGYLVGGDVKGAETHPAERAALGRKCGSCSLCCKLLDIPEIDKPDNQWCKHCKPGHGCTIYDMRPPVCRAFACQWLVNSSLGMEWLPTRSKMVLRNVPSAGGLVLNVSVDPGYPNAWRKSPYYEHLKHLSTRI